MCLLSPDHLPVQLLHHQVTLGVVFHLEEGEAVQRVIQDKYFGSKINVMCILKAPIELQHWLCEPITKNQPLKHDLNEFDSVELPQTVILRVSWSDSPRAVPAPVYLCLHSCLQVPQVVGLGLGETLHQQLGDLHLPHICHTPSQAVKDSTTSLLTQIYSSQ